MISLKKNVCRLLILAMMALSFQTAGAGMIGTERAAADGGAASQRSLVMATLDRSDTAAQLQAMGVDLAMARERVASMTDQEVRQLAGDIQFAPAGADASGAIAVIFIVALIWIFAFRM